MRSCKARFEGGICPPSGKRQRILEFSSLMALSTAGLLFLLCTLPKSNQSKSAQVQVISKSKESRCVVNSDSYFCFSGLGFSSKTGEMRTEHMVSFCSSVIELTIKDEDTIFTNRSECYNKMISSIC